MVPPDVLWRSGVRTGVGLLACVAIAAAGRTAAAQTDAPPADSGQPAAGAGESPETGNAAQPAPDDSAGEPAAAPDNKGAPATRDDADAAGRTTAAPAEPAAAPPARARAEHAPAAKAAAEPAPAPKPEYPKSGFSFGSYGRVVVASDGRGGEGRNADVVAHGSRIDESTYAELELRRDDNWSRDLSSRVVTTLAIGGPIFHYNGKFDAKLALRNLYVEEKGIGDKGLSAWVGSRMYRGDDIYLLDYWPLDNLNTVGGGVRFDTRDNHTYVAWHVGMNRMNNPFQLQVVQRPAAQNQPGTTDVNLLDRPRVVSSLKVSSILPVIGEHGGLKGVLYGEVHRLPSGTHEKKPGVTEAVPGDSGVVIGAQLGMFTGVRDTFVNLFFRYARGLAAYGEFGTPGSVAPNHTTSGAHEALVGLSGNWEYGPIGVMLGGYFRSFRNESPEQFDFNNLDEGIIVARPHFFIGDHAGVAIEGSYQAEQRGALNVATNKPLEAQLWRFGVIPFLSPAGRGDFKRPQLRLIWAVTRRNDDARALYPQDDPFAIRRIEQFFGIGAEWWFNSTSYSK